MIILCRDIEPFLEQSIMFDLPEKCVIGAISPFLVMVGAPSGTFTIGLYSGATPLFEESFTSADIKSKLSTSNNHGYIYYPFNPNIRVKKGNYKLKISSTGYTPGANSFICWAQQHENVQNTMSYLPSNVTENSLAFRVKVYREGII